MRSRGAEATKREGAVQEYKSNLLLHMGQKSRDDPFNTGSYPSVPPPLLCSTCLSERSEKLETAQEELTIFSLGDQIHCGPLKLKIQISCTVRWCSLNHYKVQSTSFSLWAKPDEGRSSRLPHFTCIGPSKNSNSLIRGKILVSKKKTIKKTESGIKS